MLRFMMQQPHVVRWMLAEKQARLEVASAGNITALTALSVREEGDNAMAKVHACKTLETMLDNVSEKTGVGRVMEPERRLPGLQIVILPQLAPPCSPPSIWSPSALRRHR